jgi:hypothetical protein
MLWMIGVSIRASRGLFCKSDQSFHALYYALPILFFVSLNMIIISRRRGVERINWLVMCGGVGIVCIAVIVTIRTGIC